MGLFDLFRSDLKKVALHGQALRSDNLKARRKAVQALSRIGHPASLEVLLGALKDPDDLVRLVAVGALEGCRSPEGVEVLIKGLQDEDPKVRAKAAELLGGRKDPAAGPALLKAIKDEHPKVRGAAAWALGELGGLEVVGPLAALLQDDQSPVRVRAARALGQLFESGVLDPSQPVVEEIIPALIAGLRDPGSFDAAGSVLRRIGLRAVPPLLAALTSGDLDLFNAAAWVVSHQFLEQGRERPPEFRDAFWGAAPFLLQMVEEAEILDGPKSFSKYVARAVNTLGCLGATQALPVLEKFRDRVAAKWAQVARGPGAGESPWSAASASPEVELKFIQSAIDHLKPDHP